MSVNQEKIDGLIALMRKGIYEGERTAARKALERLCAKHDLNLEDVLRQESEPVSYMVKCKNEDEAGLFAQVIFAYAEPVKGSVGRPYKGRQYMVFKCKPSKYLELMAAWSVLKIAWREEQKVFQLAFISANHLYGKRGDDDEEPELTEEERNQRRRAAEMAMYVKRPEIHKQLSSPQ